MRRRELARYHDIAASTKVRGAGIGFAGVGIKIALLVSAEVLTETRRRGHHVASAWRLASRQKAPWRWVPAPGLVADHGTAVRLILANALSLLVDPGFIEASLRRNFQPLFEPALGDVLREHYPGGVVFVLNSRAGDARSERVYRRAGGDPARPQAKAGRHRLPRQRRGPPARGPARGRHQHVRESHQQLAEWGDASESTERARRRGARPVERDLELVLADLADDFPLVASIYSSIDSRRPPQVFVMEPTDAWLFDHAPLIGGCTLRRSGASLPSDKWVRVPL